MKVGRGKSGTNGICGTMMKDKSELIDKEEGKKFMNKKANVGQKFFEILKVFKILLSVLGWLNEQAFIKTLRESGPGWHG